MQDDRTAELGMGGANTWRLPSSSSDEVTPLPVQLTRNTKKKQKKKKVVEVVRDSNSEEEDTLTVTATDLGVKEPVLQSQDGVVVIKMEDVQRKSSRNRSGAVNKKTKGQVRTNKQKKQKK